MTCRVTYYLYSLIFRNRIPYKYTYAYKSFILNYKMEACMKVWYNKQKNEVIDELESRLSGLQQSQVQEKLRAHGENVLSEERKKSVFQVFIGQFADLMVIILIIAALISMFTGDVESTLVILVVLVLNAVLGTVQHVKAEKSLDSLKSLSTPMAKVLRDGVKNEVASREIVPGDIILLEAGDMVVADGRIIENYSLQVNESSLTGESTNVDKRDTVLEGEVALGDRVNMVYSGSLVTYGRATVVVTDTGMSTEIGKIATLMNQTKDRKTPLQESLDKFSGMLAAAILVVCALVFLLGIYRDMPIMDSLLFAVALAVAAIPEALSSIVTIVQAMGTQKMARENAIIKNLSAVESLGCVSVICSDKTGTLTQNKMTVQEIYVGNSFYKPQQLDISSQLHRYILYNAILTNDSDIVDGKGIGDPTEYALLEMYHKVNGINQGDDMYLSEQNLRGTLARIQEVPFDSDRKLMSTKHSIHGKATVFTKGALDVLLERCVNIRDDEGVRAITDDDKRHIMEANQKFSENGLRVLAFAYKETDEELSCETEYGYTFIGLISMMDPPREESIEAVADAKKAGIKTVMITGDHKVTATAIARQIGIFEDGDIAVTGMELDKMSDDELARNIAKISVYARVSPENKIRIVDAWQKRGKIVSMTGDGVNDAPALKRADIGVAMGITGTEVSKDAASMILADDNFATIIKAVANGRTIYQNIKNAIMFLLSGNLSAIITVLFTSFLDMPIPFAAVQLLFINLVTDSLPALAIGMEPGKKDVLNSKPRNPKKGIMDKGFVLLLVGQGALISVSVIAAYLVGLEISPEMACTMAFATLTLARLFHGFNCRSDKSLLKNKISSNWWSLGAWAVGVCLVAIVLTAPPVMSLFLVEPLTTTQLAMIVGLAVAPTVVIQLIKVVRENC